MSTWSDRAAAFAAAVEAFAAAVDDVADWDGPGLGEWRARHLIGHTLRGAERPRAYFDLPVPKDAEAVPTATSYFAAYLRKRQEDPTGMDASVAARGTEQGADLTPDDVAARLASARDFVLALTERDAHRLVQTPFGPMPMEEYLPTRTLEMTVHGLDLARAAGLDWKPPVPALRESLRLVADLAAEDADRGGLLLLWLTGRSGIEIDGIGPVLR